MLFFFLFKKKKGFLTFRRGCLLRLLNAFIIRRDTKTLIGRLWYHILIENKSCWEQEYIKKTFENFFGYFISNGCLSETLIFSKKRKLSMGLIIIRLKIYYIYIGSMGLVQVYRLKMID